MGHEEKNDFEDIPDDDVPEELQEFLDVKEHTSDIIPSDEDYFPDFEQKGDIDENDALNF
jgi:hypothetical protein